MVVNKLILISLLYCSNAIHPTLGKVPTCAQTYPEMYIKSSNIKTMVQKYYSIEYKENWKFNIPYCEISMEDDIIYKADGKCKAIKNAIK